jgi:hypothetical protein
MIIFSIFYKKRNASGKILLKIYLLINLFIYNIFIYK